MANWQDLEFDCTNYLNDVYGEYATFENFGGYDSTSPDIIVRTGSRTFYMEVKDPNAQSGQFVVIPNLANQTFMFSERNRSTENEFTRIMLNYMNENFDYWINAGTSGEQLEIDDDYLYGWIEDYYKNKGVAYFITCSDNYIILPVDKFHNYFDVRAVYREKRSGSSNPSLKYVDSIINYLSSEFEILKHENINGKLIVFSEEYLDKHRFILGDYEFLINEINYGEYEIRQLSNTRNMNVIFDISLKMNQSQEDLINFERSIGL